MMNFCPSCEQEVNLEFIQSTEIVEVRGEKIPVTLEYYKCPKCKDEIETSDSPDELAEAYKEYRNRHKMVQPEDIRAFRKKYGLTQREMSNLLGWGGATLSRYENGALQDETHDKILHLAMEPANLFALIKKKPTALNEGKRQKLIKELSEADNSSFSFHYSSFFKSACAEDFIQDQLDQLNGYKTLDITKLFNAILFFCSKEGIERAKLNRLLFYADFLHFKRYGTSITGARYSHIGVGPVLDNYDFYIAILHFEEETISLEERFYQNRLKEEFMAKKEPDLSIFENSELKVLREVKEYFKEYDAIGISKFSHKEEGYQKTSVKELISYNYAKSLQI